MQSELEKPQTIWYCKVGIIGTAPLPPGADLPMRDTIERAFKRMTGIEARFCFSGWGQRLEETELAVVENRLPRDELNPLFAALTERDALKAEIERLRDATADAYAQAYWDSHEDHLEGRWHKDNEAEGYQNWLAKIELELRT